MFFLSENPVRRAVSLAGGPTKVSNALSVSNSAVHKWIATERVPDIDKARKLSELSDVALEKLRPV